MTTIAKLNAMQKRMSRLVPDDLNMPRPEANPMDKKKGQVFILPLFPSLIK